MLCIIPPTEQKRKFLTGTRFTLLLAPRILLLACVCHVQPSLRTTSYDIRLRHSTAMHHNATLPILLLVRTGTALWKEGRVCLGRVSSSLIR